MAGAKDIPGPEDGRVEAAFFDGLLALGAHLDKSFHHRGRMGNADVNKVGNRGGGRDLDGFETGFEIYFDELAGFGGARVGNTDELDKGIGAIEQVAIGSAIERVANYNLAALWQFVARFFAG